MPEIRQVRQIVRKIALKRYGIALAQQFEQMAGRADGRDRQEPDAQDPSRFAAAVAESGDVELTAEGLPPLRSAAPAEFGGPGNRWSPETLPVDLVADIAVDGDPDGEPVQACHREHTTHASAAHLKAQPSTLKRLCN